MDVRSISRRSADVVIDEQEGGSEWELAEAIRLMGEAQASGDPEQIATAMRRHAEALTNATNTTMIPTLKNVLETVVRKEAGTLAARIDATVQQQDQRFGYILAQMGAFLEKEDARHDAYDNAEASTLAALTSVAHRLDEITSYVQQSVTLAREAQATGKEALAIAKANKTQMVTLKKAVVVLKKGQTAVDRQLAAVLAQLEELSVVAERTNTLAEEQNRLVEEQNRLAAVANELTAIANDLALEVEDLKVRIAAVELRGG